MERRDPLEIDPETMRQLGYRTVDLLVARLAGLRAQPVLANADLLALMDEIPELAAEITRTARDRLPGL
jgi:NAD-dependent oxidoreductase involved in siderophore biosynthesis